MAPATALRAGRISSGSIPYSCESRYRPTSPTRPPRLNNMVSAPGSVFSTPLSRYTRASGFCVTQTAPNPARYSSTSRSSPPTSAHERHRISTFTVGARSSMLAPSAWASKRHWSGSDATPGGVTTSSNSPKSSRSRPAYLAMSKSSQSGGTRTHGGASTGSPTEGSTVASPGPSNSEFPESRTVGIATIDATASKPTIAATPHRQADPNLVGAGGFSSTDAPLQVRPS
jgi:hypothetical protein